MRKLLAIFLSLSILLLVTAPVYANTENFDAYDDGLRDEQLDENEIPEVIDQRVIRENQNVKRLYSQETDLNSCIFQNRDGTKTMYYFGYPIKYVEENGTIRDKSNQIEKLNNSSYSYYTPYNDIQTFFPEYINGKSDILVKSGNYQVSFTPVLNIGVNAELSSSGDNTVVQYKDAFGKGYLLQYSPQFTGVKEEIVIDQNLGQYEFNFLIQAKGLTISKQGNHVVFTSADGTIVGEISDVLLYDSSDNPQITSNNVVELHRTELDDTFVYSLLVDKDYLNSSDVRYPVHVDPSITISSTGTGASKTILDTPIYSNVPSTCQGANIYNVIGNANALSSDYGVGRTLMKFPGLINSAIFQGVSYSQVTNMNLYLYSSSGSVSTSTIYVNYYTGSAWNETSTAYSSVTWNGYGTLLASKSVASGDQWISLDIKSAIPSWQTNSTSADKGVMIRNSNETSTSYSKTLCSTESSYKPYVSLTWSGTTPTGITSGNIYTISNNYSSRFLSASSNSYFFQTDSLNSTYGYQLWRFEEVTTGVYRIESLGVRSGTVGLVGNMLTATATDQTSITGSLSLTAYSASNTKQWWYINRTSTGYSFISYYYPQLAISVSSNSALPRLTSTAYYSKWSLSAKTYSYYWGGSYTGASSPYIVNVIVEPSAVTGLLTASVYSCATAWNNIDDNMFIRYYPSTYSGSYQDADFTVRVRGVDSGGARFGRMVPTPNNLDGNWTSAVIEISTEYFAENEDYDLYDRQMNFLHELGHALKLRHPHDDVEWHPVSIMNQGLPSFRSYLPCRPSGYDKYNLSRKW